MKILKRERCGAQRMGAASTGAAGSAMGGEVGSGAGALVSAGPVVTASTGQASVVGRLSAPPSWAVAASEFRTVARALPLTGASAAPAVWTGSSGSLFSQMALAGMAGRAMGGTVGLGHQQSAEAVPPQRELSGPITSIADELQKLAELRDSKVLTHDEFTQLKQRLLAR